MKCQNTSTAGILLLLLWFFGCGGGTASGDTLSSDTVINSDTDESGGEYSLHTGDHTDGREVASDETSDVGSEEMCGGGVSLMLEIFFAQYFRGEFVFLLIQQDTQEVFFRESIDGAQKLEKSISLKACRGSIELLVFNDFDEDGLFDPGFEGMSRESVFISTEDLCKSVILQLPFSNGKRAYPQIATTYLNPSLSEENEALLQELSSGALLILDHSLLQHSPEIFVLIRALNPEILLLVYTAPMSIARLRSDLEQEKYALVQAVDAYMAGMWHGEYVEELQHWPGSSTVNFTMDVLARDVHFFDKWAEMHGEYLLFQDLLQLVDGFFFDECWDDISWIPRDAVNNITGFDTDYDFEVESLLPGEDGYCPMDIAYQGGWMRFLQSMQEFSLEQGRDWILIGNEGHSLYYRYVNKYFEDAPSGFLGGFAGTVEFFSEALLNTPQGIAVWNVAGRQGEVYGDLIQRCRLGAFIANILGGYYGCDDSIAHDHPLFIDEDFYSLGRKVQGYHVLENGVWLAVFEHGVNLYNGTGQEQEIRFGTELLSIPGIQRPDLNTGLPVLGITLPSADGILLLYQE